MLARALLSSSSANAFIAVSAAISLAASASRSAWRNRS
jgi:hypothetical protein